MKLIIDIPEQIKATLDNEYEWTALLLADLKDIVVNKGIPLDKIEGKIAEPKRVIYIGDGYYNGEMVYDMAKCPSCGERYEDDEPAWKYARFCMQCGQAISWEMEWEAEGEEE